MVSQDFIQYYGEKQFVEMLEAKLIFHDATNLSDSEIERCLKDCVLSNKLIVAAIELRSKINWERVIRGQKKYNSECDNIPLPVKGQLALAL